MRARPSLRFFYYSSTQRSGSSRRGHDKPGHPGQAGFMFRRVIFHSGLVKQAEKANKPDSSDTYVKGFRFVFNCTATNRLTLNMRFSTTCCTTHMGWYLIFAKTGHSSVWKVNTNKAEQNNTRERSPQTYWEKIKTITWIGLLAMEQANSATRSQNVQHWLTFCQGRKHNVMHRALNLDWIRTMLAWSSPLWGFILVRFPEGSFIYAPFMYVN